jgi:hypothetical protein
MVFIDFAFCFLIKMNVSMFQNAKVQIKFWKIFKKSAILKDITKEMINFAHKYKYNIEK